MKQLPTKVLACFVFWVKEEEDASLLVFIRSTNNGGNSISRDPYALFFLQDGFRDLGGNHQIILVSREFSFSRHVPTRSPRILQSRDRFLVPTCSMKNRWRHGRRLWRLFMHVDCASHSGNFIESLGTVSQFNHQNPRYRSELLKQMCSTKGARSASSGRGRYGSDIE
ncbi:hypothetical protein V6N13_058005 [Hibiscus sabdariffa]